MKCLSASNTRRKSASTLCSVTISVWLTTYLNYTLCLTLASHSAPTTVKEKPNDFQLAFRITQDKYGHSHWLVDIWISSTWKESADEGYRGQRGVADERIFILQGCSKHQKMRLRHVIKQTKTMTLVQFRDHKKMWCFTVTFDHCNPLKELFEVELDPLGE